MKRIQKVLIQKKTIIAIISLFCLILGSCSSKIDKKNNVAYVDGQAISKNLYEKELSYYQKFYLKKYGNNYLDKKTKNGLTNYERLESELLDSLVQDQIMINDLRKNKVKITKNDSLEVIEDLSKKSMSKDSLIENVKSFGADEDEFDEISYMDSIRKKHMDYYFSNDDTKDSEIVDYFK